ncbi:Colicin V production protein [Stieleria bergensis]|uniref:Colicin V production protein n=1 Tax=Stieleria bergensis TaxID=2528025 RepID=A0A517SQN4_9BACT|nr:Colicin V production protein [Planctomycetes bacterium SV_7m_r]
MDWMESLAVYDYLMLGVLAVATIFGGIKGVIWQVASIASLVASSVVAIRYSGRLSESIRAEPPWDRYLATFILFVATSFVIWAMFMTLRAQIERWRMKSFDRQIGALVGLLQGVFVCILITLFSVTLLGDDVRESIVASPSGRLIATILHRNQQVLPPGLQEVLEPSLEKLQPEQS